MRFAAIITAAGRGTRMGQGTPKQYMELGGKPMIWYSINAFEQSAVNDIYITCPAGDENYVKKNIVEKYGFTKVRNVVAGGSERSISVLNGILAAEDADYVMIHDAARPLISQDLIRRCIEGMVTYNACVPAVPVSDTIKVTSERDVVVRTMDRSKLRAVQTPQCFKKELILDAYEKLGFMHVPADKVTDDASVVELSGLSEVKIIKGDAVNRKVTNTEDVVFVQHYLEEPVKAVPLSQKILFVLLIVSLAFIWLHSLMPQDVSSAESGFVYDVLFPLLKAILPDEWVTELFIRKAAHFSEYAVLGIEMLLYAAIRGRIKDRNLVNILFSGLTVAFIDETIQIFAGRGPMITDVWIDLAGFVSGAGITYLIVKSIIKNREEHIKSREMT